MANSFSNVFSIFLAVFGALQAARQSLPARYIFGYAVSIFGPHRLGLLGGHFIGNRTGGLWKLCISRNPTFPSTIG